MAGDFTALRTHEQRNNYSNHDYLNNRTLISWQAFLTTYLKEGSMTPLGKIKKVWWRQEDQSRGSLHVHCAVWVHEVEPSSETPDSQRTKPSSGAEAICGTVPRSCKTAAERHWRAFVKRVQTHKCIPGKCYPIGDVQKARLPRSYRLVIAERLTSPICYVAGVQKWHASTST